MNNTTRDALIERIAELADQFACGAAGEPVIYPLHGPADFAEEVIELVTAARDAEIRSALLSDGAVEVGVRAQFDDGHTLPDDMFQESSVPGEKGYGWGGHLMGVYRDQINAALDHIGLHGDGTGGQG